MMRFRRRSGNFFISLLINMVFNPEWLIAVLVLLGLHFWLGISILWCVGVIAVWVLRISLGMWLMGWAADCSRIKDPPKENKNPYSVRKEPGDKK
jgi:hypothetical protein